MVVQVLVRLTHVCFVPEQTQRNPWRLVAQGTVIIHSSEIIAGHRLSATNRDDDKDGEQPCTIRQATGQPDKMRCSRCQCASVDRVQKQGVDNVVHSKDHHR